MTLILPKFLFVFLLAIICLTTSCGKLVVKNLEIASYYNTPLQLIEIEGLTLFAKGAGVNSYGYVVTAGSGGFSKNSFSIVKVEYPITIIWRVEGEETDRKKSFNTLDGFTGNEIKEEVTIWLYFDETGEPNLKVFWGDWMVSRRQLEEVAFGKVWKSMRRCSYFADDFVYIREIQGLGLFDVDYEKYMKAKNPKSHNMLRLASNNLESNKYTDSDLKLDYPVIVKWSLGETGDIQSKSFESIDGFKDFKISEKTTIWLYFDENGEPHFKFYEGDWMVSREEMEKDAGLTQQSK